MKVFFALLGLLGCGERSQPEPPPERLQSAPERLARELAARHALDIALGVRMAPVVRRLTKATRFSCYRINSEFAAGCLKLYFVRPHSIPNADGMCGYAGDDTIFCDAEFLTGYLDGIKITTATKRDALYAAFQTWVLGHEIGHADLRHTLGHFLTAPFPVTQTEAWRVQRLEYEADRRFTELAGSVPDLEQLLELLFAQAYSEKYGPPSDHLPGLHMDHDPGLQYPYVLSSSHPHMTIRTAELLVLVAHESAIRADARAFIDRSGGVSMLEEVDATSK